MGALDVMKRPQTIATDLAIISENAAFMQMIERAARDPAVDIDKLDRLLQMKERVAATHARQEFNEAMAAVQAELPQVVRNAENTQTSSMYATLEKIGEAIDPIITAHGFSQSFGTEDCPISGHYRIVCTTAHIGGHERTDHVDIPIDSAGIKGTVNKTATHAFGSTMNYGRRYLTILIFNVKTRKAMPDDDGNSAGKATVTDEQADTLRALALEAKADMPKFLEFFKAESIADISIKDFDKARKMLEAKRRQQHEHA